MTKKKDPSTTKYPPFPESLVIQINSQIKAGKAEIISRTYKTPQEREEAVSYLVKYYEDFRDKVQMKVVSPWTRTYAFWPKTTISGKTRGFCFLYKKVYENAYNDKRVLWAESEFEILKHNEED
jgi:hypothetical protein